MEATSGAKVKNLKQENRELTEQVKKATIETDYLESLVQKICGPGECPRYTAMKHEKLALNHSTEAAQKQ